MLNFLFSREDFSSVVSRILVPMTRFPNDPIFQITRSPDHQITRSQALVVALLRCVGKGFDLPFTSS